MEPGGPAARAGLRDGDLVVAFAGAVVAGVDELHRALRDWPPGRAGELVVLRRGQRLSVEITPALAPAPS